MVFRNDPCPCGSGKRYKKCCLRKAKQAEAQRVRLEKAKQLERERALATTGIFFEDDLDELDELSNSVLDLIKEKKFDIALNACATLLERWPEVPDGFERSGMVHEAMGELAKAKDFYAQALAFTQRPDQIDHFDDEGLPTFCRDRIAAIEARLTGAA